MTFIWHLQYLWTFDGSCLPYRPDLASPFKLVGVVYFLVMALPLVLSLLWDASQFQLWCFARTPLTTTIYKNRSAFQANTKQSTGMNRRELNIFFHMGAFANSKQSRRFSTK